MSADSEIRELMGLFDLPAFARRGQDVEFTVDRMHGRCDHQREELLEMVRLRLRQWSKAATGPDDWSAAFTKPVDFLWKCIGSGQPTWSATGLPRSRQRAVARDLIASVERFNLRWRQYIEALNLEPANQTIDDFNQYYVLEKECVMGSARLAARHFRPVPRFCPDSLLLRYPLLPVPVLA